MGLAQVGKVRRAGRHEKSTGAGRECARFLRFFLVGAVRFIVFWTGADKKSQPAQDSNH